MLPREHEKYDVEIRQLKRLSGLGQSGYRVTYVWVWPYHRVIESGPDLAVEHAQTGRVSVK